MGNMTGEASLAESGKLRIVSGGYGEEMKAETARLPNCKFDARDRAWYCDATPAAAWRLFRVGFDLCNKSLTLAETHGVRSVVPPEQPEVRKLDSWRHQLRAYRQAVDAPSAMLAMDMGTGKTKVAVDIFQNRDHKTCLVLCPSSVLGVWRREFNKFCAVDHDVLVLDGKQTAKKKAELVAAFLDRCRLNRVRAIVVVNYESAWRPGMDKVLLGQEWGLIVADESHRVKSPTGKASKFCAKLRADQRLALTGTPLAHSPMDTFGQYRYLDAGLLGTSWTSFRARYAVTGHFGANHIVDYRNLDELAELLATMTVEVRMEDTDIELPPVSDVMIDVPLTSKSAKVYKQIEQEMAALVAGGVITVANALTKTAKLRQVTSGFIQDTETGEVHDIGTDKVDALRDLLEDINEPVVVFCCFREDLRRIQAMAEKMGRRYGELSGSRKDLTPEARMPDGIDIMGAQIQSGGTGIDLTRSRIVVYYDQTYSLADYLQSRARAHRPGQTRPTTFFHMIAGGTIDEQVYRAQRRRKNTVDEVMEYLRKIS